MINDQVYVNNSLSLQVSSPVNLGDCEDDKILLKETEYNDNYDNNKMISISPAKKTARLT